MSDRVPLRPQSRTPAHRSAAALATSARTEAVRAIEAELESWRQRAIPDPSAPLDSDDIARLVGDCLVSLGLDEAVAASCTVHTVHFYRRKEILDPPEGRTSAARYTVRHLWQAVGARLAGQLALLTLAEARQEMADKSERVLLTFVAQRVLDARARQAARRSAPSMVMARPLAPAENDAAPARRLGVTNVGAAPAAGVPAIILPLPGDAWCVVPTGHPAHRSAAAARALGRALTDAILAASDHPQT